MGSGEVKYGRRFNLGNYEHEEISVSTCIDESVDVRGVILSLREMVLDAQKGEDMPVEKKKSTEPKEEKTKATKKTKKVVEVIEEEEIDEEVDAEELAEEEGEEQEETEEEFDDEEEEEVKPAKKKATKKVKTTPYDRKNNLHKKMFGDFLNDNYPSWKNTPAAKDRAKNASAECHGKEFLDNDGQLTLGFKTAMARLMAKPKQK